MPDPSRLRLRAIEDLSGAPQFRLYDRADEHSAAEASQFLDAIIEA